MPATLHYIYDPLCGWCYGAEPLVRAAAAMENLAIDLHAGGLWPEPTSLPDETRRYIQQADARIARMSGQPFGDAYLSGLLLDRTMILDSRPPIAAVLVAQSLAALGGLRMLRAVQRAHYVDGRRVVESDVLCDIAAEIGLERAVFASALLAAPVDQHIRDTRRLMADVGADGFPAFLLQDGERLVGVPHQRYAGNAAGFRAWLASEADPQPTRIDV